MEPELAPRDVYRGRQAERLAAAARHDRADAGLAAARLALFTALVVLAWLVWGPVKLPAPWLVLPVLAFLLLGRVQGRVQRARDGERRAAAWYGTGLERLQGRWRGRGRDGARFLVGDHPYARDLDLLGPRSLFELLNTVHTAPGEETLAAWLTTPASREQAEARQTAVAELRNRLDLREELARLAPPAGLVDLDPELISSWARAKPVFPGSWRGAQALGLLLGAAGLGALVWGLVLDRGLVPLAVVAVLDALVLRALRPRVDRVLGALRRPQQHLQSLARILARLEAEPWSAPGLTALRQAWTAPEGSASRAVTGLGRRVDLALWYGNQVFMPLGFLLLWPLHTALAVERWRVRHGADMPRWLAALGEAETLLALATYAYEHPADPLPRFVPQGPHLVARGLGHPLLPEATCVRNDVELAAPRRLILVSGSNMSGKSTLLRTVGINVVLAQCGAPVRATALELSELGLGATLRVEDSLQDGRSRFYAELLRLQKLMELARGPRPLLFLLDEILHGTNSHDRVAGASGLVRALLERGAAGLVTTHDLALAQLAEDLGAQAVNVHFQDDIREGRMVFDYRVRPGVVRTSNALALMRSLGLGV